MFFLKIIWNYSQMNYVALSGLTIKFALKPPVTTGVINIQSHT